MSAFADGIDNSIRMLELLRTMEDEVHAAAQSVSASVGMKGRVFVCGSSLSASPANLLADELNRKFYPVTGEVAACSLCSDIKLISAVCRTSPDDVFASQLRSKASENDLLFAMAFMDGGQNAVLNAMRTAHAKHMGVILATPFDDDADLLLGEINEDDVVLSLPADSRRELIEAYYHIVLEIIDEIS